MTSEDTCQLRNDVGSGAEHWSDPAGRTRGNQNLKIGPTPAAAGHVLTEEGFEKSGCSQGGLGREGLPLLAPCSGLSLPKRPALKTFRSTVPSVDVSL